MSRFIFVLFFCFAALSDGSAFAARAIAMSACPSSLAAAAKRIKEMKEKSEITSFLLYAGVDKVARITFGVPHWVRTTKAGSRVFRRYLHKKFQSEVVRSSELRGGACPYVNQSDCYREEFPDLVGIFITTRSYSSESVGLEAGMPYVDFTLPPETELIRTEPGIYLIPNESLVAPILRQIHEASSDQVDRLKKKLKAAEKRDRIQKDSFAVPINILKVGRGVPEQ